MKYIFRLCTVTISVLILALSFSGCGKKTEAVTGISYDELLKTAEMTHSTVSAENGVYGIEWNDSEHCIILKDKNSGAVWSTTPYDYESGTFAEGDYSPVNIEFIRRSAFRTIGLTGKTGSIDKDTYKTEQIENGIRLTFFFDEVKIAVPIDFTLTENGLKVSVNSGDIAENYDSDNRIFKITVAPYLCAVKNSAENYLIIPSGSGALMYADSRGSGLARTFSADIYGEDITEEKDESFADTQSVRMPVFGVYCEKGTLCAIVDGGAETAEITASAGDSALGYSYTGAVFQVRGYNGTIMDYGGNSGKRLVNYYSDEKLSDRELSVIYSSLSGNEAGYMGIARYYRNYLINKYSLEKSGNDSVLALKLTGGREVKKFIFGVPYYDVEALTDFSESRRIIENISELTGVNGIKTKLTGYGKNGNTAGKLAGGFGFDSSLGKADDLLSVNSSSAELFFDFDIVKYSKSGNGFSSSTDVAHTANGYPAYINSFSPVTGSAENGRAQTVLLSRAKTADAAEKLLEKTKKLKINGVSLSTLSSSAYSDFSDKKYMLRGNIAGETNEIISRFKSDGIRVAAGNANDYAASVSDMIFDAPDSAAAYNAFDLQIPLYQIVFKGYVPFSNSSVNLAQNSRKALLNTVETGAALQFSLINGYSSDYAAYLQNDSEFTVYENNIELIKASVNEVKNCLEKVKNTEIVSYDILNDNVRRTVYGNGTAVYVNYGETDYTQNGVTVSAMNFRVVEQNAEN